MQRKQQVLSASDHSRNSGDFDSLMGVFRASHPQGKNLDAASIQPIKEQILKFANEQLITLNNLSQKEQTELAEIVLEALHTNTINQRRLNSWKENLSQAKYGQGNEIYLAQSTGMAQDLCIRGVIPAEKWGTDLDVIQCLGNEITDPRAIKAAGTYILTPISLTESDEPLRLALAETLESLKGTSADKVTLSIPANCGDKHWCEVNVEIQGNKIQRATLWDSLPGNPDDLKSKPFYTNMRSAITKVSNDQPAPIAVVCAGEQKDLYTCMDRTIQKALKEKKIDNEITLAGNNELPLRIAVVRQIARNHEVLNHIANSINEDYIEGAAAAAKKSTSKPASQKTALDKNTFLNYLNWGSSASSSKDLEIRKQAQVSFDSLFAKKLSENYKAGLEDKAAEEKAYNEALEEFTKNSFLPKPK